MAKPAGLRRVAFLGDSVTLGWGLAAEDAYPQLLQDRLDDPTKHWKFAIADLDERKRWDDYQAAYGEMIGSALFSATWPPSPSASATRNVKRPPPRVTYAMRVENTPFSPVSFS